MHSGLDLAGKVALVTGGGSGLGAATCEALAGSGATVVAADLNLSGAAKIVEGIRRNDCHAEAIALDVRDDAAVEEVINDVARRHGGLDILVNNAGVDLTAPIEEIPVEEWDRIAAVNLRAPFLATRAAFPVMRSAGGGHIVNIVSTAATRAWANASAYHATKWGLLGFSHASHVEGRPLGIKVTAVISGGMRTPFLLDRFPDIDPAVLQDPRNVAATVLFALAQPPESVIPEVMVLPMRETSWP